MRKVLRVTRKESHGVNLIPGEPVGRWIRIVWIPTIVGWCLQPWLTSGHYFRPPPSNPVWTVIAFTGAIVCVGATVATFSCWREMGRSWRIGIDPTEKTQLIFGGPFRIVRHPIYALSIFLVLGTLATTPTAAMLGIAVIHIACVQFEAHREEVYLLKLHGSAYAGYMRRVGRFFPRLSGPGIEKSTSR